MTVSQKTVDTVFVQIKAIPTGVTYPELAKLTGLAIPTVRESVSHLKRTNSVSVSIKRPVTIKAVERPPLPGQIIEVINPVTMPDPDLDSALIEDYTNRLADKAGGHKNSIVHQMLIATRELPHDKLRIAIIASANMLEVMRRHYDSLKELTDDDIAKLLDGK